MSRLHCITPWQGRKPSVLSEELLLAQKREEKTYVFVPPFFWQKKWRREWDSNPRTVARRRFSKPVLSATQPSLRILLHTDNISYKRKKSSRILCFLKNFYVFYGFYSKSCFSMARLLSDALQRSQVKNPGVLQYNC